MKPSRIVIEGWVYSSRQNGVVVGIDGVSLALCAGCHAGVETRMEWGAIGWNEQRGVKRICPALRATDYKIPKYVWFIEEAD